MSSEQLRSASAHVPNRDETDAYLQAYKKSQGGTLLLGHTKLDSTVRYLGIEIDDALEMAEQTDA